MPCHLWTVIRRDGSGRHAVEQASEQVSKRALRFKLATLKDWSFARAARFAWASFNMKRVDTKNGNDLKYDHETIAAIAEGYFVFWASGGALDPPRTAARWRVPTWTWFQHRRREPVGNREAQVLLFVLLGIPYTGSDSATLSICGQGSHQEGLEPAQHSHAWVSALCDRSRKSGSFFGR